jgi:hypothetical protein
LNGCGCLLQMNLSSTMSCGRLQGCSARSAALPPARTFAGARRRHTRALSAHFDGRYPLRFSRMAAMLVSGAAVICRRARFPLWQIWRVPPVLCGTGRLRRSHARSSRNRHNHGRPMVGARPIGSAICRNMRWTLHLIARCAFCGDRGRNTSQR